MSKNALIVGVGSGNSASFARALATAGYQVVLAARNIEKLDALCQQTGAIAFQCENPYHCRKCLDHEYEYTRSGESAF